MTRKARRTAAAEPVPRQLPLTVRDFAGRFEHLAALDALLPGGDDSGTPGAVVISAVDGTAGIGKTTLAVHWAHRVQHLFPDGTLYVNLRGYGPGTPATAGEVLDGFLRALGVPAERIPPSAEAQAALFRSLVADRQVLIVLDNANRAEQVRPLLPASPRSLVVVTSRDSLTGLVVTEGASRLTLDLLSVAEALSLVTGIVGAERAGADPASLGELVRLCARLPLALRIAAGRVASSPHCTVAEVVEELTVDRFRLDALSRDGDERATVRAVFDWSYQRLTPAPARLFRRLGLHPGSDFSLPAAAALAELPPAETRPHLGDLRSAHLIEPLLGNRYGFHDLLRAYASDLARQHDNARERQQALESFLGWYAKTAYVCDELLYPAFPRTPREYSRASNASPTVRNSGEALSWVEAERRNMLPVLRQAVENEMYVQGLRLAENSRLLGRNGRWHDELEGAGFGLTCAKAVGDRPMEARFHNWLGECLINVEQWSEARDHFELALSAAQELGSAPQRANALNGLGLLRSTLGDHEEALPFFFEALPLSQGIDTGRLESVIEGNIGSALSGLHRYVQAIEHGRRSLALRRRSGDVTGAVHATHCLARAHLGLGEYPRAIELSRNAIAEGRQVNYTPAAVAEPLDTLGKLLALTGDVPGAVGCWREAASLFDSYHRPKRAAEVRARIADTEDAAVVTKRL